MKKWLFKKWLWLTVLLLCAAVLFHLLVTPLLVDRDTLRAQLGTPLSELTQAYAPEQAAADGCLVDESYVITAGKEQWNWFRFKATLRIPASIRICTYHSTGDPVFTDVTFDGREFALHHPDYPADYARFLKYSKATHPYRNGLEGQNTYYLSTAPDGNWYEYMYSTVSANGDMPDYVVYPVFSEWALP